jgi:Tfp pilus assembly protein FimT
VGILGILATIATPAISRAIRHQRVNKAAALVAADLQNVFAMAGRQRAPVHLASDASGKTYTFSDRKTGAVFQVRDLGTTSEYQIGTLVFSPTTVDMFPNGSLRRLSPSQSAPEIIRGRSPRARPVS